MKLASALILFLVAVPLAGQAASRFVDVTSDNPLAADIEWLEAWGITKGCSPTHFCPTDPVTREQMAAFLHRFSLSGLADGATGAQGPAGPAGPTGPAGPQGPAGSTTYYVATADATVPKRSTGSAVASCSPGDSLVGGGISTSFANNNDRVVASHPLGNTWVATIQTFGNNPDRTVTAYAVCLDL